MIKLLTGSEIAELDALKRCVAAAESLIPELSGADALYIDFETADEEEMRACNYEYMGKDSVTDVLSFPALTKPPYTRAAYPYDYDAGLDALCLGQVLLCQERAAVQADEYGSCLEREICYLFTHSLLHLCGYDHAVDGEERAMHLLCEEILSAAGIKG